MSRRRITRNGPAPIEPDLTGAGVTRPRGFICRSCDTWFGVFQNVTELNAGPNAINGDQKFTVECPTCSHSDEYATSELSEFSQAHSPVGRA